MVSICQQCGARGWPEASIYCEKCQIYYVHWYCLAVLPKSFKEYVSWFCDKCKPTGSSAPVVDECSSHREAGLTSKKRKVTQERSDAASSTTEAESRMCETGPATVSTVESQDHPGKNLKERKVTDERKDAVDSSPEQEALMYDAAPSIMKSREWHGITLDKRNISEESNDAADSSAEANAQMCETGPGTPSTLISQKEPGKTSKRKKKVTAERNDDAGSSTKAETPMHVTGLGTAPTMKSLEEPGKTLKKKKKKKVTTERNDADVPFAEVEVHIPEGSTAIPLTREPSSDYREVSNLENLGVSIPVDGANPHCSTSTPVQFTGEPCSDFREAPNLENLGESVPVYTANPPCSNSTPIQLAGEHCSGFRVVPSLEKLGESVPVDEAKPKQEAVSVRTSQMAANESRDISEHYAQPIIDPIWRGNLSIRKHSYILGGLVGHLSSLACSRVSAMAESLPELLSLEVCRRDDVWPKGFLNGGPNGQSIALYFFPDYERDEKEYDDLVYDMIRGDLAMRVVLDNAELLIFNSSQLPLQYRRFGKKLYLWGVFRRKQASVSREDPSSAGGKDLDKGLSWITQSPVSPLCNDRCSSGSSQMSS